MVLLYAFDSLKELNHKSQGLDELDCTGCSHTVSVDLCNLKEVEVLKISTLGKNTLAFKSFSIHIIILIFFHLNCVAR